MPFIQLEFQKDAFLLFLTRTQVETLNNDVSISSTGSSIPFQARSEQVQANHNQRNLRALLNFCMSRIPSPTKSMVLKLSDSLLYMCLQ